MKFKSNDILTQRFFKYLEETAATEYSIPESQDLSRFYNLHGRDTFEFMADSLEITIEPLWTWKKKTDDSDSFYSDLSIYYRQAELSLSHANIKGKHNKFIVSMYIVLLNGEKIKKYYFIPDNIEPDIIITGFKVLEGVGTKKSLIETIDYLNHTFSKYQSL